MRSFLCNSHRVTAAPLFPTSMSCAKNCRNNFPGIEFNFDTGGMLSAALNGGLPAPINIQVEGNKLEVAHEIAEKIKRYAETVRGAVDVRIQQRVDAPQINIDIDRVKAAQVGLTQEE